MFKNPSWSASCQPEVSREKSMRACEIFLQSEEPTGYENESLKCEFCNVIFKHKQSLWKHKKFRCDEKKNNDEKIKTLEKQLSQALSIADNNSKTIKKSMSTLNYILKNYSDAPAIALLEDDQFDKLSKLLVYDDKGKKKTNKSIEEILIFHHKQGTFADVLGDLIVRTYKKKDPAKQSAWSSDIARLTFIVKDIVGKTKKSKWVVDKKGLHFTEVIIIPLMNKIKELLVDYVSKCGEKIKETTNKPILTESEEEKTKEMLLKMQ
jgi:hypothetical protein